MADVEPLLFADAGRIPAPGDNVAIATRTLPAGARIFLRQIVFEFAHTVLEGHRFAIHRIRKGEPLLSWGLPFGLALRDLEPGEYVCNAKILAALSGRQLGFPLPDAPNFSDYRLEFTLDESSFRPGKQVSATGSHPTFQGFLRGGNRGAGTRNCLVVLGTSARAAGFARQVAERFRRDSSLRARFPNVDGVVPVDHTEGGSAERSRNHDLTLRTLAGFVVHPNVGAVLCVDFGSEALSNLALQECLRARGYPLDAVPLAWLSIGESFAASLDRAEKQIAAWLPLVNQSRREPVPISHLRLGLQCGGSDAFSGVSGNPLVGLLSRDTVARGGSANLAETDELIGAESYILANARDLATAKAFLSKIARFQEWASWHGHSAEGNPSGGNMFRGLYNITIKSIGAARKKDPATRLDHVIDFGERMAAPGFYFMDSPGNDLESIAGQVAAGCNLILFATGNGSITNFPFVPTIKIMTTSRRFELVRQEMDFNAGRYLDGEALEDLGREAFAQMLAIASGGPSAGEKAGHSQVQLWREWRRDGTLAEPPPAGAPPPAAAPEPSPALCGLAREIVLLPSRERVALVLPTSLCSGQVARMITDRLNARLGHFGRAVALPHTEGCGNSAGESEQLFLRTMAGYLAHPFVAGAVLLEHGCEKTHNDAFRGVLRELGLPEERFGFASVQLDGGIDRSIAKVLDWFAQPRTAALQAKPLAIGFAGLNVSEKARAAAALAGAALAQAGSAVLMAGAFADGTRAALGYGERAPGQGLFAMDGPTNDLTELLTGLAGSGAQLLVAFDNDLLVPSNPMAPTVQVADAAGRAEQSRGDVDLLLPADDSAEDSAHRILQLLRGVRSGERLPRSQALGNTAFQITRGRTGISL